MPLDNSGIVAVGIVAILVVIVVGFLLYVRKYKQPFKPLQVCCKCCKCCLRAVGYAKVRHTLEDFENEAFQGSLEELKKRDYDNLFNFDGEEEVDFDPTDIEHLKLLENFRDTLLEDGGSDALEDSTTPISPSQRAQNVDDNELERSGSSSLDSADEYSHRKTSPGSTDSSEDTQEEVAKEHITVPSTSISISKSVDDSTMVLSGGGSSASSDD